MKLTAEREKLLTPLQAVIGVVERRQTMPVLANVLLGIRKGQLTIAATDLEVELVAGTDVAVQDTGDITVPGRKFLDILRALPEKVSVALSVEGEKVVIKAGRSRFSLSTLPAADFPVIDDINSQQTVQLPRKELLRLLEKTHFSMAQQDVRYYLNGMLLKLQQSQIPVFRRPTIWRLRLCAHARRNRQDPSYQQRYTCSNYFL